MPGNCSREMVQQWAVVLRKSVTKMALPFPHYKVFCKANFAAFEFGHAKYIKLGFTFVRQKAVKLCVKMR